MFDKDSNMLWTMAPKPTMADSMYNFDFPWDENSDERIEWMQNFKHLCNENEPVKQSIRNEITVRHPIF